MSVFFLVAFVSINLKAVPCEDFWPCDPLNIPENNGWVQQLPVTQVIDGCNGCTMTVTFSERYLPCLNTYQLQLEGFTFSEGCNYCFSPGALFQKAVALMLKNSTVAGTLTNGQCVTGVEVVNVSCWKWVAGNTAPWVMSPCSTDECCKKQYTICMNNGELEITYASDNSNYVICRPDNGATCLYICDWLPEVGILARSINIEDSKETVSVQSQNNSYTTPNPADGTITIGIQNKIEGKLNFDIFNSTGERITSSEMNCKMIEPKLTLDISNFVPGVYLYNINQDGKIIGNGKFVVKH